MDGGWESLLWFLFGFWGVGTRKGKRRYDSEILGAETDDFDGRAVEGLLSNVSSCASENLFPWFTE